jgi:two-component system chemotaxis response regulator CheB
MSDETVVPTRGAREHHVRPAIDVLFRTAAREFGPAVTAVLPSGAGVDGTAGVMAVRSHGGEIVVQRVTDGMHESMPRRGDADAPDHLVPAEESAALLPTLAPYGHLTRAAP